MSQSKPPTRATRGWDRVERAALYIQPQAHHTTPRDRTPRKRHRDASRLIVKLQQLRGAGAPDLQVSDKAIVTMVDRMPLEKARDYLAKLT